MKHNKLFTNLPDSGNNYKNKKKEINIRSTIYKLNLIKLNKIKKGN